MQAAAVCFTFFSVLLAVYFGTSSSHFTVIIMRLEPSLVRCLSLSLGLVCADQYAEEPYRWDSVAEASRIAIAARYRYAYSRVSLWTCLTMRRLLPFLYTQMVMASRSGRPPIRALFYEFPTQPELFGVDSQWLISDAVLITPVLTVNVSSVEGYFPGHDGWRDW